MLQLYKGIFNCNSQDVVLYHHAHSLAQAKQLMLLELAQRLEKSIWLIRMQFGDWCTNFKIEEEQSKEQKIAG